jgi:hypothetical protein
MALTVREVIEILAHLPQDATVRVAYWDGSVREKTGMTDVFADIDDDTMETFVTIE